MDNIRGEISPKGYPISVNHHSVKEVGGRTEKGSG